MLLETNKVFLIVLTLFLGAYALYAFATSDYIEGFSATRPWLWTPFRLSTVACASLIAYVIWRLNRKPFQTSSYVIATVTGGIWLLLVPFWYDSFQGFAATLPVGAALSYGLLSGFFGAAAVSRLFAALIGFLALIAQLIIDAVGYLIIVGYAGFH